MQVLRSTVLVDLNTSFTAVPLWAVSSKSDKEPEVQGLIPGLAIVLPLPLIQEGQLSVTGESMCT